MLSLFGTTSEFLERRKDGIEHWRPFLDRVGLVSVAAFAEQSVSGVARSRR